MLTTNGLTKRYGSLTALDGLTLTIEPGETFGLLGPNGAGKTTTLRLMVGLTDPTEGSVRVDGRDPWTEPAAVRHAMGVLLDSSGMYERQSVKENLDLFAGLYGVDGAHVAAALEETGASDLARRPVGKLSKGQRQRVALARALVHRPKLLFLDEPTAGLDPSAAESFHQLMRRLGGQGVTIVLSSHDMAEVDLLCGRVAILDHGRLMACDTPSRLKARYGRRAVRARVETPEGIRQVEWDLDGPDSVAHYAQALGMGRILALHTAEASLAEVFVHLTGREMA